MSGPRLTDPHHEPGYEPKRSPGGPWGSFEGMVEDLRTQGVADPTALAGHFHERGKFESDGPPLIARTRTAGLIHPNSRHTWVGPEDDRVNVEVDNNLKGKVRKAVEEAAEEAFERAKRRVPRL